MQHILERGGAKRQQALQQHFGWGTLGQHIQALQHGLRKTLVAAFGVRVEHRAAAQCFARGRAAQDVTVAAHRDHRLIHLKLQPALFAGQQLFTAQKAQAGQNFGRADEELDLGIVAQRLGDIWQ